MIDNVISFNCCPASSIFSTTSAPESALTSALESGQEISYFFLLDTEYNFAFSHWVFESAVFIPLFLKLRNTEFPNLRLVIHEQRKYKDLFFRRLGVDPSWVVEEKDMTIPNRCITPDTDTFNNNNANITRFLEHLSLLKQALAIPSVLSTVPILYLPRQKLENYVPNDRTITNSDEISDLVIRLGGSVLHTDNIEHLEDQMSAVNSAKIVITDWGSSFLVNSMFANDTAKFIILGRDMGHLGLPGIRCVFDEFIKAGCTSQTIIQTPQSSDTDIYFSISEVENAIVA
jgi:hypothetical protein